MTPTDLAALVEKLRDQQTAAHRFIILALKEPGHSPTEDALIDAIRCLAAVTTGLIDLCVELNDRLPMSTEAFGEVLGGK